MSCYALLKGWLLPSQPLEALDPTQALPTEQIALGPYSKFWVVSLSNHNLSTMVLPGPD